jgi:hypothetical protein
MFLAGAIALVTWHHRGKSCIHSPLRLCMAPELAGLDVAGRAALVAALMEEDPFCPAPPEESKGWTEARLRAFFQAGGVDESCGKEGDDLGGIFSKLLTREQVRARHSEASLSIHLPTYAPRASRNCTHSLRSHRCTLNTQRQARSSSSAGSRAWTGAGCSACHVIHS